MKNTRLKITNHVVPQSGLNLAMPEFGYEYDLDTNEGYYLSRPDNSLFADVTTFRSGRDALKSIAKLYSGKKAIALLPALSCESMIVPFTINGLDVRFYSLLPELTVDYENLKRILRDLNKSEVIVLYMNYFGIPQLSEKQLTLLRLIYNNVTFIEDRTHSLFCSSKHSFEPDYIVASIRKWISMPDGGLLWHRNIEENFNEPNSNRTEYTEKKILAQWLKSQYHKYGNERIKAEYRAIFSTVSALIDNDPNPAGMSITSQLIMRTIDYQSVIARRRENIETLMLILWNNPAVKPLSPSIMDCPLYLPILVQHRDSVQNELSGMGIYCTQIWPLTEKQKQICQVSKNVTENILAIPCDQRYTARDMIFIANAISKCVSKYTY